MGALQSGSVSKRMDEDRLVFKRFGDGASSLSLSRLHQVQEYIVSSFDVPVGER